MRDGGRGPVIGYCRTGFRGRGRARCERENSMRYRTLGRTGLYISELCLGTMTFGGKGFWEAIGKLGAKEVEGIVGAALDAGVNFVDTADVYSEGESEKLLGA